MNHPWQMQTERVRVRAAFLLLLLLGILCASGLQAEAPEEDKDILFAIGEAGISDGNQAAARDAAVKQALGKGVEAELLRRMDSRRITADFERIASDLLPRAPDLIQNFTIQQELLQEDRLTVLLRLRLNQDALERLLRETGLLEVDGAPQKVLFLVSERRDGTQNFWWLDPQTQPPLSMTEILLHQAFQTQGYDPVNRLNAYPGRDDGLRSRGVDLQAEDICRWGALFGAELVVFGQSRVQSAHAVQLSLAVYDVRSRARLAEGEANEDITADVGDLAALDKAVERLMQRLMGELPIALGTTGQEVVTLEVALRGFGNFEDVNRFRAFIEGSVPGVQSVTPSRAGRETVSYEVLFRGVADQFLALVLDSPHQPFPLAGEAGAGNRLTFTARPVSGR